MPDERGLTTLKELIEKAGSLTNNSCIVVYKSNNVNTEEPDLIITDVQIDYVEECIILVVEEDPKFIHEYQPEDI